MIKRMALSIIMNLVIQGLILGFYAVLFVIGFIILLTMVFPVILALFFGASQLFIWFGNWYIEPAKPSFFLYVAGYTLGTALLSVYIYYGFYRDEPFDDVVSRIVVPAAFTVTSIRWLPLVANIDTPTFLTSGVAGYIYVLPIIAIIVHTRYLHTTRQKSKVEIGTLRENLNNSPPSEWRNLVAFHVARWARDRMKNAASLRMLKTVGDHYVPIFSVFYLSAIIGVATYIVETRLIETIQLFWWVLIVASIPVAVVMYIFHDSVLDRIDDKVDNVEDYLMTPDQSENISDEGTDCD